MHRKWRLHKPRNVIVVERYLTVRQRLLSAITSSRCLHRSSSMFNWCYRSSSSSQQVSKDINCTGACWSRCGARGSAGQLQPKPVLSFSRRRLPVTVRHGHAVTEWLERWTWRSTGCRFESRPPRFWAATVRTRASVTRQYNLVPASKGGEYALWMDRYNRGPGGK